ncbi:hypothetical protein Bbelb_409840 [Branchiostoma belcheri]|nr:hypothetical protein Bbelb_409840 [Branchiostoma belcheri]
MAMCPMIAGTVFLIQGCVFTSIGFSAGDKLPPFKVIGPTFLCLAIVLLLLACFCCKKARDAFNQQGGHTVQVVTSSTAPQAPGQTVVTGAPVGHAAPTVMAPLQYPQYPASGGHPTTASGTTSHQSSDHAYQPSHIGIALPPSYYEATVGYHQTTSDQLHVSADPHVSVSLTDKNFGENTVAWMPALVVRRESIRQGDIRDMKGTTHIMNHVSQENKRPSLNHAHNLTIDALAPKPGGVNGGGGLASWWDPPPNTQTSMICPLQQTNGALSSVVPEFQRVPSASPHRHLPDGGAKKPSKEPARTPAKETRNTQCEMLGRRYLRHCQCGLSDLGLLTAAFIGSPTQLKSKAWSQTFLLRFYTAYLATEVTISYIPGGRVAETRHVNTHSTREKKDKLSEGEKILRETQSSLGQDPMFSSSSLHLVTGPYILYSILAERAMAMAADRLSLYIQHLAVATVPLDDIVSTEGPEEQGFKSTSSTQHTGQGDTERLGLFLKSQMLNSSGRCTTSDVHMPLIIWCPRLTLDGTQSSSPVNYLEFDMLRRQLGLHLTEIKSVKRLVMDVLVKLEGIAEEQEKMSLRQHTDAGPTVVVPKETCLPVQQKKCPGIMYVGHISCTDILLSGTNTSGIYTIYPRFHNNSFPVYCDMDTNGGGWTVIQRRINGSIKFFRPWKDYKEGFGDLEGEFWLGLDNIHALTRSFGSTLLRIQVETFEGHWHIAQYDGFKVANESENYRMTAGRFTYGSNVPDSFSYHDGANFSTFDRDNDGDEDVNCGKKSRGGWWYKGGMPGRNKCGLSNPNGLYHLGAYEGEENGIYWYFWRSDYLYSFRKVVMMVRPSHYYYSPTQGHNRRYDAASLRESAPSADASSQYYYQRYMQADKPGEK